MGAIQLMDEYERLRERRGRLATLLNDCLAFGPRLAKTVESVRQQIASAEERLAFIYERMAPRFITTSEIQNPSNKKGGDND